VRLNLQLEEQLRKSFAANVYIVLVFQPLERPGYACLFQADRLVGYGVPAGRPVRRR
jgi:hypothetical protein